MSSSASKTNRPSEGRLDSSGIPIPDKSQVRLSSETRNRLAPLMSGRFLDAHDLSFFSHNYFDLLEYQKKDGIEAAKFPSSLQVADSFADQELDHAEALQPQSLLISPPNKTGTDLMSSLNYHFMPGARIGPVIGNREPDEGIDWALESDYRAFIVEGGKKIDPGEHDNIYLPFRQRLRRNARLQDPNEWGMTADLYALLAMQSIARGDMIDRKTFTILDREPVVANKYYPVGHCLGGHPTIELLPADRIDGSRGRFRKVIGASDPIEL